MSSGSPSSDPIFLPFHPLHSRKKPAYDIVVQSYKFPSTWAMPRQLGLFYLFIYYMVVDALSVIQ